MSLLTAFQDEVKKVAAELQAIAESISKHVDPAVTGAAKAIAEKSTQLKNALVSAAASTVVPTITSISPPSGPVGTVLTITGTGFGISPDEAVVRVGGSVASPSSWSDTKVVVTVPAGGAKKGDVSITTAAGKSTGAFSFTVA